MHNKQYQQPSLYIMEVGTTDMIAFSVNTPSDKPTYTGESGDGKDATAKEYNFSVWDEDNH
jgi:hypothetical protein